MFLILSAVRLPSIMMQNFDNFDNNELIQRAVDGDKDSFCALVKRHYGAVIYYLMGLGVSHEDAQDVTQETFINAYNKLRQYKSSGSFVGWLLRIARNRYIDRFRKDKKFAMSGDADKALDFPDLNTPEAQVLSELGCSELYGDMKPRERVIIELRVFQRLSYAEIAEITGFNEVNVRVVFHRAIARLRDKLKGGDE